MASITNEPNGRRTVQFVIEDGRRRSVRLGKVSKRQAELVRARIEELLAAKKTGQSPSPATREWVSSVDTRLRSKLASAGLIENSGILELEQLVSRYLTRRTDLKPKTKKFLRNAGDKAIAFFGANRRAGTITVAEAHDWRRWMLAQCLSEATVRTHSRGIKQVFRDACDRKLLDENPFVKLPSGSISNTNDRFVTIKEIDRVLAACPSDEWRALLTLCRFAGLRCPSETHRLRWGDVDLNGGSMTVHSPKTERHLGHDKRVVPIQPRLAESLIALPRSPSENEPVLDLTQHNLHKRLARIVTDAGVAPWADPFHCLRRSCQTEWVQEFPEYAVAAWIGNSTVIARRHYLKIPHELMRRAASGSQSGAESGAVHARMNPHSSATRTMCERGRQR